MTETLAQALVRATRTLARAAVPGAAGDARALLVDAAKLTPMALTTDRDLPLDAEAAQRLADHLDRRARLRQPVSQIVGRRLFWGRAFEVTADVLDPRPETETLIARALDLAVTLGPAPRILDLGTGSGILAITLLAELPRATAVATDISAAALKVAERNAQALGVADRLTFHRASWFDGIEGTFDLVVSNPPYIPEADVATLQPEVRLWEPRQALTPGPDGLAAYRAIAAGLQRHLGPSGIVLLEHGAGQSSEVARILRAAGPFATRAHADMDSKDRIAEARWTA